jgi:hypothetical protein
LRLDRYHSVSEDGGHRCVNADVGTEIDDRVAWSDLKPGNVEINPAAVQLARHVEVPVQNNLSALKGPEARPTPLHLAVGGEELPGP